jgi:hypothetical protein
VSYIVPVHGILLVLFVAGVVVDCMPLNLYAFLLVNTGVLRHKGKVPPQLSLQRYPLLVSPALVGKVWVLYVMLEWQKTE